MISTRVRASSANFTGLRMVLPYAVRYRWRVAVALAALLLASAAALAVPMAFNRLMTLGLSAQHDVAKVDNAFQVLSGLVVLLSMTAGARTYVISWLAERIGADIRSALFRHLVHQDAAFFETTNVGEVLSRLTVDIIMIQGALNTSVALILRNFLLLAGALGMMLWTSPALASIVITLLAVAALPLAYLGLQVRTRSRQSHDQVADVAAFATETLNVVSTVQQFTHELIEAGRFCGAVEKAFSGAIFRNRASALASMLGIVITFGVLLFVLWLGTQAVLRDAMRIGDLIQFILYSGAVASAMAALSEVSSELQRAAGAAERLLELLDMTPQICSPDLPILPPLHDKRGACVSMEAVTFHYPSRLEGSALSKVSLRIEPGETVALVGNSGAGKTTLFHLLLRFYDPQSGVVRIDGIDVRQLHLHTLREKVGIVHQDPVIFSTSVFENIRYGREGAQEHEVMRAARMAGAHEFIDRLPGKYHCFVGRCGVRLSGGQRQRIAIARALLKDPELLLLDEATSALDAESERLVQIALEKAAHGRTTIIIAHRLATVRRVDRIFVVENGKIVESGNHASLSTSGGAYARLAQLQFDCSDDAMTVK